MKKALKKIVGIAMSAMIAFSAIGAPASFADDSKSQLQAQDAIAELTGTFDLSKSGEYIYPDNFAGTWYDDGILHVISTDERGMSDYKEILKDYDCVEYELAKFSLNELRNIQKKLSGDMQSIEGLVSIGVSQKYNKIYLGVCDVEKNIENVREKVWSIVNENNYLSELLPNKNIDNELDFDDLFVISGSGVPITDQGASTEKFKDTHKKIDGVRYVFAADGTCKGRYTGWTKSDKGQKYWRNGILVKNRAFKVKGISYYADENGIAEPAMVIKVACPDGTEYVSNNGGETWRVDGKETDAPAVFVKKSEGYPVKLSQGLSIDIYNTSGSWMSLPGGGSLSIWKNSEWEASPFRDGVAELDTDLDGQITDAKKYPITISFDKYEHENGKYRYEANVGISVYDARKDDIYTFTIEFYAIADNSD